MTSENGTPDPSAPTPAPGPTAKARHRSDAILPWGERLDEIAQERFDRTDWIELAAAVILALATIIAAWSAYQATRWGGVQASSSRSAIEAKTDAAQQTSIYTAGVQIDVLVWTTWLQQAAAGNATGQAFLEERFRDQFKPAFEAWMAQVPEGEVPPGTPFDMDEYQPVSATEAARLNAEAQAFAETSAEANQTGDNFVLTAVVMASVLFFAGVGTKLKGRAVRLFMLLVASLFFLGGLAFMLSMPQNVGI
jgi:hypothetical protein